MPFLLPLLSAGILGAMALPFPVLQDSSGTAPRIEVLQAGRDQQARLTIPVTLDEHGPFQFLIDTGAERTVIGRSTASRLGLVPSGTAVLMGIAGTRPVDLVDVEEVSFGRRTVAAFDSPVLDDEHIGADGILGLDSLQGQRILMDFANNRLAVDSAHALGGNKGFEIVVTARRRSGQLIMTDAVIDGVRASVIIDTGAETSIGNRALQRALAKRNSRAGAFELLSVTGQVVTADRALAQRLTIGRISLSNTEIAFADAPPFAGLGLDERPALLLGMTQLRLFKRVAIDFAARRILFDLPDGFAFPTMASTMNGHTLRN